MRRAWDFLTELSPHDGCSVVDEVSAALARPGGLRNANAYFMVGQEGLMGRGTFWCILGA